MIYLDHNATSPLRPEAHAAWLEVVERLRGNPSSLHAGGRWARDQIDLARERVAGALGVLEDELVFTSGGTESNNTALLGALRALGPGARLISDAAEHPSVLAVLDLWQDLGGTSHRLGVDADGRPDLDELTTLLRDPRPTVVSCSAANNEVGVVPNLEQVRARVSAAPSERVFLHVDAVQALGKLETPRYLPWADGASFSAHKVGGPTGVGVLVRKKATPGGPLMVGGGQEFGWRPGTENTAGIVAASIAIELAVNEQPKTAAHMRAVTEAMRTELARVLPRVRVLGPKDPHERLPNTLCLLANGHDGKVLVTRLDLEGLAIGAGSACSSGSVSASHVLLAMGLQEAEARAAVRVSVGRNTSHEEGKRAVAILCKILEPSHTS